MLDLTRSARTLGFVFLAYFAAWPVLAVLEAVLAGGLHVHWLDDAGTW